MTHAGHRSVVIPIASAMPLACFAPFGHVPYFFCHSNNPALKANRIIKLIENSISLSVGFGLGVECNGNMPSSHANIIASITLVDMKYVQNCFVIRNDITRVPERPDREFLDEWCSYCEVI